MIKKNNLSDKDDILIQSYFIVAFLTELKNLDFLNSEYYKNSKFQDSFVQENLPSIGIDNRGCLIIFLYALLVLPKEQFKDSELEKAFDKLNKKIKPLVYQESSNYKRDIMNGNMEIQYLYHIRNAIVHCKIKFENNLVVFNDINNKVKKGNPNEECQINIQMNKMGAIITLLQMTIIKYLKTKN